MAIASVKATINGQEYTLTSNGDGTYSATINAPSTSSFNETGGYYPVSVTALDDAGNSATVDDTDTSLGANLKLVVKETVAPTITVLSPTTGSVIGNATPTITWNVTDDDSGVATSTIRIDTGDTITVTGTAITGGMTYSYTPSTALSDGAHVIYIGATDNDGNVATTATISITVDTAPPVLTVTSPAADLITNQSTLTVAGSTNDATSGTPTVTVNGEAVTVDSDGNFSTTVELSEGSNTITVKSTDSVGQSVTVTRTVTLDTVAPVFEAVSISPNPVDAGATYIITVTVSD